MSSDKILASGIMANCRRPVRTFCTACIYYHKFRLLHKETEYQWSDAAAAALLTACKIEDTLKKSREILCAAYNSKVSAAEYLSSDDPVSSGQTPLRDWNTDILLDI